MSDETINPMFGGDDFATDLQAYARRLDVQRQSLADFADQRAAELDPEVDARLAQAEMAYRMQASVPELTDLSDEKDEVFELYGPDSRRPGMCQTASAMS